MLSSPPLQLLLSAEIIEPDLLEHLDRFNEKKEGKALLIVSEMLPKDAAEIPTDLPSSARLKEGFALNRTVPSSFGILPRKLASAPRVRQYFWSRRQPSH